METIYGVRKTITMVIITTRDYINQDGVCIHGFVVEVGIRITEETSFQTTEEAVEVDFISTT